MLDKEELLHLAIQEMQSGSTENAINHLKNCLKQDPQNANAQYLLGALHAELGMYQRAVEEMEAALKINPDMPTARFQLGLLLLTSGEVEKSKEIWHDLVNLGAEHPLYLFKEGMIALSENRFEESIDKLKQGIAINTENDALNNDMHKMITKAQEALNTNNSTSTADAIATNDTPPTLEESSKVTKPISLSAYESQDDSDNKH